MIICKDKYLNKWVVWLKQGSMYFECFHANTKKKCEEYIEKHSRK